MSDVLNDYKKWEDMVRDEEYPGATFKKLFPILEGIGVQHYDVPHFVAVKRSHASWAELGKICDKFELEGWFPETVLLKTVLDRQRVKDAFDDLLSEWIELGGDIKDGSFDRVSLAAIHEKMKELDLT